MATTGRNDPCPCGSGKKYKKCCLDKDFIPSAPSGSEESVRARLVQEIMAFGKRHYQDELEDAYDFFWDGYDPKEYMDPETYSAGITNFFEWIVYDWGPEEDGKTLAEHFAEGKKGITPEKRNILDKMGAAHISLYEVQEVFPEKGLRLKDIFTGEEHDVRERAATRSLHKWDILATRLLRIDGENILSGCGYLYHREDLEWIIKDIKKCFKDYKKDYGDVSLGFFLKRNGYIFNDYWYDKILNPVMPELFTTSGEEMLLSKAVFKVNDMGDVLRGLKEITGFQEAGHRSFQWLDEEKPGGTSTVLGNVTIKSGHLYLECNSRERLERGKALLVERLSGSLMHRNDVFQDPFQAIKDSEGLPERTSTDEIPKETEQEIYTEYMRNYYEGWVNEKIPRLNGKTPMEAIRTPAGKKKVIDLLKTIDNMEERKQSNGEPYADMTWLWERLGIKR